MQRNINRLTSPVSIRWAAILLVTMIAAIASWLLIQTKAQAVVCTPWAGDTSLQATVDANMCTEVQSGTYMLSKIPPRSGWTHPSR